LKLTTDRHEASRGLSATAELLVITYYQSLYLKHFDTQSYWPLFMLQTKISHCEKKLVRLLFDIGVVNTTDDDREQQVPTVALFLQQLIYDS